jgi:hypothetical protein
MYEFFWNLANRVRSYFGLSCQPRRCCKKASNLAHFQSRPDLMVSICRKCGSRHFGLTIHPGVIGVRGARMGA